MSRREALRVGITIGLHDAAETLWNNGIKQNAVFLAETLAHCPIVESVRLVNTTAVPITPALPWDLSRWPTVSFDDALDGVDVLIELGGQVSGAQTAALHARGAKLVSYCCTVEYVLAMESVLFGRRLWGANLFINPDYDEVWAIPQVADISASYFGGLRRRPVKVVPFVWDPVFLEQRSAAYAEGGRYTPRPGPRRISVMEPNIDVVKFCLYPAFIAEEAYRRRPELIAMLQVANAFDLARNPEFAAVMGQLDLVRDHKAVFTGRHDTPAYLAEHTDAVVSHQWDNPLNYFYLEVCWQGYPLVHNASLCAELGYYYPGNDVDAGCAALLRALQEHDRDCGGYLRRQREAIARFLPGHPGNVSRYGELLKQLVNGESAGGGDAT